MVRAAAHGVVDRRALEDCVVAVALALSVVMAGTGHLPTFKLLRGKHSSTFRLPERLLRADPTHCYPACTWSVHITWFA